MTYSVGQSKSPFIHRKPIKWSCSRKSNLFRALTSVTFEAPHDEARYLIKLYEGKRLIGVYTLAVG